MYLKNNYKYGLNTKRYVKIINSLRCDNLEDCHSKEMCAEFKVEVS